MHSTLSFTLAISFFIACSALDDDNLQLPHAVSILSNDDRPSDPSLNYQTTMIDEIDNNNNGVNPPPFIFDQTWTTPSGDANAGEAYAATAAAEDLHAHTYPPFNSNAVNLVAAGGCYVSEEAVKGENKEPAPLCPILPAHKAPTPPTAATEEEKKRVMTIEEDHKIQESAPPLSSAENKFDWNAEICPPDIYGALRQVPVCHSGNELLKVFDSLLGSWTLWDTRPRKFFFSFFSLFPHISIYEKRKRKHNLIFSPFSSLH